MITATIEIDIRAMCAECGREIEARDGRVRGRVDVMPCECQGAEIQRLKEREKELEARVFELVETNAGLIEDANRTEAQP